MRGRVNDCLRYIIGCTITILGFVSQGLLRVRIACFRMNQKQLRRRYGLRRNTPVLSYGPEVEQSIQVAARRAGRSARFAKTSGSTGKAKEILYTKRRLVELKLTFGEMFVRACFAFGIKHTSLYVFSSFQTDSSLTSLLLDETKLPDYVSTLQAPYRVQHHTAIRGLVSKYGPAAVRLWILAISNPGMLYSTNASTISTFLDELANDWPRSSKLIKDWFQHPAAFPQDVRKIARRVESSGCAMRLKQIASSDIALPLAVCAPAVEAYICWTGGYVQPFLNCLAKHLPSPQYRLIPMYSMSTETIETLLYFHAGAVAFLPISRGVVYEFIQENAMDHAENLLNAQQLEPGKRYAMVVSDRYGLRRYQTDDLFLCKRKIHGLPDLVFVRRRSLEYSFTGEKVTAEQMTVVFKQLRARYPAAVGDRFLTCVPLQCEGELPHYNLMLIGEPGFESSHDVLAACCDELLGQINCEYKSKRASGRLGPVTVEPAEVAEFVQHFAAETNGEAQFKFLPLCLPHSRLQMGLNKKSD